MDKLTPFMFSQFQPFLGTVGRAYGPELTLLTGPSFYTLPSGFHLLGAPPLMTKVLCPESRSSLAPIFVKPTGRSKSADGGVKGDHQLQLFHSTVQVWAPDVVSLASGWFFFFMLFSWGGGKDFVRLNEILNVKDLVRAWRTVGT